MDEMSLYVFLISLFGICLIGGVPIISIIMYNKKNKLKNKYLHNKNYYTIKYKRKDKFKNMNLFCKIIITTNFIVILFFIFCIFYPIRIPILLLHLLMLPLLPLTVINAYFSEWDNNIYIIQGEGIILTSRFYSFSKYNIVRHKKNIIKIISKKNNFFPFKKNIYLTLNENDINNLKKLNLLS